MNEINASKLYSFSSDESNNNTPSKTFKKTSENKINYFCTKTEEKYKLKISEQKQIMHKKTEKKNNFNILVFSKSVNDQNVDIQSNSVPEDNNSKENNSIKDTSLTYENDILNSLLFVDNEDDMHVDKLCNETRKQLECELDESNCDKDMKNYTKTELNVISSQQLMQSSFTEDFPFSKNDDRNFILDSLVDSPHESSDSHSFEGAKCSILDSLL